MAADGQGNDVTLQLLQRLLTRIDHLEFNVVGNQRAEVEDAREEIESVRETVKRMERARQLEAQDIAWADAWARAPRQQPSGGHRGPGWP